MSPIKSRSQLRKFGAMSARGEISKQKFREWIDETPSVKSLPERVKKGRTQKGRIAAKVLRSMK